MASSSSPSCSPSSAPPPAGSTFPKSFSPPPKRSILHRACRPPRCPSRISSRRIEVAREPWGGRGAGPGHEVVQDELKVWLQGQASRRRRRAGLVAAAHFGPILHGDNIWYVVHGPGLGTLSAWHQFNNV